MINSLTAPKIPRQITLMDVFFTYDWNVIRIEPHNRKASAPARMQNIHLASTYLDAPITTYSGLLMMIDPTHRAAATARNSSFMVLTAA